MTSQKLRWGEVDEGGEGTFLPSPQRLSYRHVTRSATTAAGSKARARDPHPTLARAELSRIRRRANISLKRAVFRVPLDLGEGGLRLVSTTTQVFSD